MSEQTAAPEKATTPMLVELMGHKKLAGRVSEETIAGAALLRIDVPTTAARAGYTKFFGASSIYCLTPVSEELMQRAAEEIERYSTPIPVHLPAPARLLPAATTVPADEPQDEGWGVASRADEWGDDDDE